MSHTAFFSFTKFFYTLLILVITAILLTLGFWQLHRAAEKRAIVQAYAMQQTLAPLSAADLQGDLTTLQYRKITLTGQFDNAHSFLLDNRIVQGQVGYEVLTPFMLSDGKTILINRGWIPKTALNFPPIRGAQTIQGLVTLYPSKTLELSDTPLATTWPKVVQSLDFTKIAPQLNVKLLPALVLLDPDAKFGFIREWQIINAQPSRHIAYAVQWFGLGLAWIVIVLIVIIRRK